MHMNLDDILYVLYTARVKFMHAVCLIPFICMHVHILIYAAKNIAYSNYSRMYINSKFEMKLDRCGGIYCKPSLLHNNQQKFVLLSSYMHI
jgi:hypothetical protein